MYSYCLVAERWDDGTRDTTFGSRCRCRTRGVWESVEKVSRRRPNDKMLLQRRLSPLAVQTNAPGLSS